MGGASSGTTTMENTLGECRPAPPLGPEERRALLDGDCHDPHAVLGAHPAEQGTVIRALRPFADTVAVLTRDGGRWELLAEGDGLFAGIVPVPAGTDYRYELRYEDETVLADDPYRFQPTLGELDLHLIGEGRHERLWEVLGSRVRRFGDPDHADRSEPSEPAPDKGSAVGDTTDTAGGPASESSAAGTASTAAAQSNAAAPAAATTTTSAAAAARKAEVEAAFGPVTGVSFAVWAPNARGVRVIGDFNYWNGAAYPLRSLGGSGVWELFVPQTGAGVRYKYEILGRDGIWRQKADPLARRTEPPPGNASVTEESEFAWTDADWLDKRALTDPYRSPMSVYELHLQSWRPGLDYRQLADQLPAYLLELGFTHVEFLPPTEHPFGGSWGYQVSSYFAPTARLGDPDDFRALIDALHAAGIGVFIDWVPAHFPKDSWALAEFDGTALYEHSDPRRGEHPDWGTLVFDYGRREVRNFLVASALFWCEQMHIDGLRVDAVASMLYLDYSREEGEWHPNAFGGRENLEAVSFLQELTATVYKRSPGVVVVAEESTAWPGVTLPTDHHVPGSALTGLGFGFKWNMGWMHDTLGYLAEDPINRRYHHDKMTFALVYAYTEKFVLAISHDEVVHGKGSLLRKMSGDRWQQLANVRAYLAFMWAHPGKQLLFSGCEFAQDAEWSEQHGLDWWLLDYPEHRGVFRTVQDLNFNYTKQPALWEQDHTPAGFEWLVVDDSDHNVFAFVRWSLDGTPLVCVVNFAAVPWEDYHLPLPLSAEDAPRWSELLNTDAEQYGGSGVGNFGTVHSRHQPWSGRPAHTSLRLPPLGTLWLVPERVERPQAELELEAELVAAAEVVAEAEQVAISAVEQEVFGPEADEPGVGEPEPVGEAEPASQVLAALLAEPVPEGLFAVDEPVSEASEALDGPAFELFDTTFEPATELSDAEAEAEAEAELAIISMIEPEVFAPEAFELVATAETEPEPELDEPELAASSAIESEVDEPELAEPESESAADTEPELAAATTIEPEADELELVELKSEPDTGTEPELSAASTIEPEADDLEVVEPELTTSPAVEPETDEPELDESEPEPAAETEPELAATSTTEPETDEPELDESETAADTEPELTASSVSEPEADELELVEPEPELAAGTEPELTATTAVEPETDEPELDELESEPAADTELDLAASSTSEPEADALEASEPELTTSSAIEPENDEPGLVEPEPELATDTEPELAATSTSEPVINEPDIVEPELAATSAIEPETDETELDELESESTTDTELDLAASSTSEPEADELELVEPDPEPAAETEPESAASSAIEPEVDEPEVIDPELAATSAIEPETDESELAESESVAETEPVAEASAALVEPTPETPTAAIEPDAEAPATFTKPELAAEPIVEAEAAKSEAAEPEVTESEAAESEALESAVIESAVIEPEAAEPEPATVPEPTSEAPASATLSAQPAPQPAFPGALSDPEAEVPGAVFELAMEVPVTTTEPPVESLAATAAVTTTPVVPRPAETDEPTVTLPIQSVGASESMSPPVRVTKPTTDTPAQATQIPAQTTAEPAETAGSAAEE